MQGEHVQSETVGALARVLPATARLNEAGHLEVGGCDVVELAGRFGTPLYVYDLATARAACRAYTDALSEHLEQFGVVYAGKAFLCRAWCELIAQEGVGLDVSSGGELWMAHAAGFPLDRVVMHGNNKTPAELALALKLGVGHIVVDSQHELESLSSIARTLGVRQRILIRLAPGVRPSTHRYMQTGHDQSKFGVALSDGSATAAVRTALRTDHLVLEGVHAHIGSQILETDPYVRAVSAVMEQVAVWRRDLGLECAIVDIGGGLGVPYERGQTALEIPAFAAAVAQALKREARRYCVPVPRLLLEPGRSIAARAGLTAYRVGPLKRPAGAPLYVAVDGGMSDNIRPMLYGSRYEAVIADRLDSRPTVTATVVGKHCESGDVLVERVDIADPRPGDVLVIPGTGAYGFSMASNYNGQPRAAVVFVEDGEAQVVVEREAWADLVRLHRPLGWGTADTRASRPAVAAVGQVSKP